MFTKGTSGNSHGRPEGAKNKRTRRLLDLLGDSGFDYAKEFVKAYKNLPDTKQFEELKYILPYVSPQYLPMADAPATFQEAVENANATFERIKALQNEKDANVVV